MLTPQTEQSPIKVNGFCTGGAATPPADGNEGSAGLWCYDDAGTAGMKVRPPSAAVLDGWGTARVPGY